MAHRLPEAALLEGIYREYLAIGHPHNVPLQIWFELGVVGVVPATMIVWLGFRRIARLPEDVMPIVAAFMCSIFAVSCVSHGAWQVWWPLMLAIIMAGIPASEARKT
jgi:O-antigen ligase